MLRYHESTLVRHQQFLVNRHSLSQTRVHVLAVVLLRFSPPPVSHQAGSLGEGHLGELSKHPPSASLTGSYTVRHQMRSTHFSGCTPIVHQVSHAPPLALSHVLKKSALSASAKMRVPHLFNSFQMKSNVCNTQYNDVKLWQNPRMQNSTT